MSFNIELLLRSKNFSLKTEYARSSNADRADETALWQDSGGPLRLSRVKSDHSSHYRLHLDDDVAVDVLADRHLVVRVRPDVPTISIDHFLADQVVPRVIAQDGGLVLHAGAVSLGESAILLLGASGRGKSTLATSFHCNGWPLMGDDAVTILAADTPCATAIYPSLRLFPDSIAALLSDDVACEDIAHYSDKQRIPVSIVTEVKFAPAPIKAIFVLDEPSELGIQLRRLSIADACMAIVGNSFALDPTDAHRARNRLDAASALARQVPAFGMSYPRDYTRLPEVRDAIFGALGGS